MVKAGSVSVDQPVTVAVIAFGREKADDTAIPFPVQIVLGVNPKIKAMPPVSELDVGRLHRPPSSGQSADRKWCIRRLAFAQDREVPFHLSARQALGVTDVHRDSIRRIIDSVPQTPSAATQGFRRRVENLYGASLGRQLGPEDDTLLCPTLGRTRPRNPSRPSFVRPDVGAQGADNDGKAERGGAH
jgi:hypothetical protein